MKHKTLFLTLLSAAAFTVGCDKPPETPVQQLDKVQDKTAEIAQDLKDYTFAQKAEFTAKMQAELTVINKELDELSAKIEKSSDATKAAAKPKLAALRAQADALGKQLDAVKDSTESTWDSVKSGTRKAYDSVKEGFKQSRQWVSDKIAP